TRGWRPDRWARPARAKARAGSGTARTASREPANPARVGSSRSSGGSARRLTANSQRTIEAVLGGNDAVGQDRFDRVGGLFDRHIELAALGRARAPEHMVDALPAAGRLADPDPDPRERVRVQVGLDRSQPVVPGQPAPQLHLDTTER